MPEPPRRGPPPLPNAPVVSMQAFRTHRAVLDLGGKVINLTTQVEKSLALTELVRREMGLLRQELLGENTERMSQPTQPIEPTPAAPPSDPQAPPPSKMRAAPATTGKVAHLLVLGAGGLAIALGLAGEWAKVYKPELVGPIEGAIQVLKQLMPTGSP
jgi:hypothetical protein